MPRGATAVPTFAPQWRRSPTPSEQAGGILAYPSDRPLSPRTARPRGGGRRREAPGGGGLVEGWHKATPPCEERGAAARRDEHFPQTMTGEFRAGHGRHRTLTGREDQADATTGGRRRGTECSAGGATLADRREGGLPVGGPRLRAIAMDCPPLGREGLDT